MLETEKNPERYREKIMFLSIKKKIKKKRRKNREKKKKFVPH
jgi:hypothetical protein